MAENRLRVSQKIEIEAASIRQIDFLVEKKTDSDTIFLQVQEDGKSFSISVVKENEKYIISVASDTNRVRLELTGKRLKWLDWPITTYLNVIEERGLDFLLRQLMRDLFVFIMENSSWKKVLRYNR